MRAVLEGTAFALANTHNVMRERVALRSVLATGGGARSDLWLELMASALGLGAHRTESTAGAAEGAAVLAMPEEGGLHPTLGDAMGMPALPAHPARPIPPLAPRAAHTAAFRHLYGAPSEMSG